ncbi:FdrA family protein [Nocardioides conyzicola]|uniref:Acyl-CoA synthetase FdrA n=1 Tax=Nocardioides conyzicola TaxID=1651781 RepID=A0ABP8WRH1_9ACTN
MTNHVELRPGAYADSVTLLQVSRAVQGLDGVLAAQVAMATALNIEVLVEMGFDVPAEATTNDLVVALRLADADALPVALAGVDQALRDANRRPEGSSEIAAPRTTASALRRTPEAAVVVVSVPGPSALVEAMDAVDAGRDVLIFSDNVPVEQEVALKRAAAERGVLVMGPDCGTAVVGGLGLGFANVVSPGPVGIVAASGTGCQQLLALLDHAGVGVTSALGVGGRDLSAEVRGVSTREALRRLDSDPAVELIVVISKPPAPDVAAEIEEYAGTLATPVEFALLGAGKPDLTAATEAVLRRLGRDVPAWPVVGSASPGSGAIRGLFVGGTLKSEAQLIAGTDAGHTFVDFGDDEYTTGRAHPMIDPSLRLDHLGRAAADPATGVLLLDVVLGHGAEPDPAALLAPAIAAATQPVVVAVVGTDGDPQGRDRQVRALVDAGAEVHLSNAGATRRALELLGASS